MKGPFKATDDELELLESVFLRPPSFVHTVVPQQQNATGNQRIKQNIRPPTYGKVVLGAVAFLGGSKHFWNFHPEYLGR